MPYNGSGGFTRVMNWEADAASGKKIEAGRHDDEDDNFASGLSNAICKDGQSQVTADIPMNGRKLTNLAAGINPTDAVTLNQLQSIRSFNTGIVISGADANGLVSFTSATGFTGLSFTNSDTCWISRKAEEPVNMLNRLALNDKADATGKDVFFIDDAGRMTTQGGIYRNAYTSAGVYRVIDAGWGHHISMDPSSGNFGIYNSGTTSTAAGATFTLAPLLSMDASGNTTISGDVHSGSGMFTSNTVGVVLAPNGPGTIYLRPNGSLSEVGQLTVDASGNLNQPYGAHNMNGAFSTASSVTANGAIQTNTQGYKPGGGAWAATSDERIKTVSGPYTPGLAAIKALNPVRYRYKGNDTPGPPSNAGSWEVPEEGTEEDTSEPTVPYKNSIHYQVASAGIVYNGLIAQEVEAILPNMVTKTTAFIDGVEVNDLRMLDTSALIYVLINACKELAARVEALEATQP